MINIVGQRSTSRDAEVRFGGVRGVGNVLDLFG